MNIMQQVSFTIINVYGCKYTVLSVRPFKTTISTSLKKVALKVSWGELIITELQQKVQNQAQQKLGKLCNIKKLVP